MSTTPCSITIVSLPSAKLRDELGYADYLGALQKFRAGSDDEPALLQMSAFLLDYPFSERLHPRALAAIGHLRTMGTAVILSDGDIVFQPRKIQRSGLWDAVEGRVLVTVHKERMLDAIQRRFPARHYVMVDDKPQLLAAMKRVLGARLTTVVVRQGHYALESAGTAIDPPPDLLWASTGTKDPDASKTLYVEALAAPDTIDTMPEMTLQAFAEHGALKGAMAVDGGDAEAMLARFVKAGIDIGALAMQLQREGAQSFVKSWQQLLQRIAGKSAALAAH